jgi:hypothetical protein
MSKKEQEELMSQVLKSSVLSHASNVA